MALEGSIMHRRYLFISFRPVLYFLVFSFLSLDLVRFSFFCISEIRLGVDSSYRLVADDRRDYNE